LLKDLILKDSRKTTRKTKMHGFVITVKEQVTSFINASSCWVILIGIMHLKIKEEVGIVLGLLHMFLLRTKSTCRMIL